MHFAQHAVNIFFSTDLFFLIPVILTSSSVVVD